MGGVRFFVKVAQIDDGAPVLAASAIFRNGAHAQRAQGAEVARDKAKNSFCLVGSLRFLRLAPVLERTAVRMEAILRRRFWIVHVLFITLSAFLLARAVGAIAASVLAAKIATPPAASANTVGALPNAPKSVTRNFEQASDFNIFGARREKVTENTVAENGGASISGDACTRDCDCYKSDEAIHKKCLRGELDDKDAPLVCLPKPDNMQEGVCTQPSNSSMRARLVGTAVFVDPFDSLASIIDESKAGQEAQIFSIRNCVPAPEPADTTLTGLVPAAQPCNKVSETLLLRRIGADRVYLYNSSSNQYELMILGEKNDAAPVAAAPKTEGGGKKEEAAAGSDLGNSIKKISDTNYQIARSDVDSALGDFAALSTQARFAPAFEGGKTTGFKIFGIRPNSLFQKLGMQNGDVIESINGYELSSPDKALELYQKLKDAGNVTIDVKRRGKKTTIDYAVQ